MKHFIHWPLLGLLAFFLIVSPVQSATTRPAHNPRRWAKEIAAFEAADQKHMPAPGGVDFVGSSSVRFWNVRKAFPGENVINRGFGGSWAVDAAYYADRIVIPYKPRTVVFYEGDNDIAAGTSAQMVLKSIKQFVKEVHDALPKTRIVLISLKPSPSRVKRWAEMQKANAMMAKFAEKTARVDFVNMTPELLTADGKDRPELFRKDMLHMNAKGYEIWNRKIGPYIEQNTDNQKF